MYFTCDLKGKGKFIDRAVTLTEIDKAFPIGQCLCCGIARIGLLPHVNFRKLFIYIRHISYI